MSWYVNILCAALLAGAGCGGPGAALVAPDGGSLDGADAPRDAALDGIDVPADGEFVPAPHPPAPHVTSEGGPVLAKPQIYPVFFAGEDPSTVTSVSSFITAIGGSAYWSAAVSEYGVGAAVAHAAILVADQPDAVVAESDIAAWLAGKLDADDPAFPVLDEDTMFALFYPGGTSITSNGVASCSSFAALHAETTLDPAHGSRVVPFAIVPRCPSFGPYTGIDALSATASHEIIETVTDPEEQSKPAYGLVDIQHYSWAFAMGATEVSDMCSVFPASNNLDMSASGLPYIAQRSWSNASAAAGHNPCVPSGNEPYFNAAPVLPDAIDVGGPTAEGVKVAVGATRTIDLMLFSDRPVEDWTLSAVDLTGKSAGGGSLTLALSKSQGNNGDTIQLSITKNASGNDGAQIVEIVSSRGTLKNYWFALVGN